MPRPLQPLVRLLPQSLVGRVYALYTVTLVIFVGLGLGLFYRYQFELALEDAQQSALMLTEVTAQTITDSAVIGDFDTIQRMLEKVLSHSPFSSAAYIDREGGVLRALNPVTEPGTSPAWMKARIIDQLTDVNQIISAGGRDYGVLRLTFDADGVTAALWRVVLSVLALALSALAGGLLLIWFPLRKWLGTLDRALQVGQSTAPEQAPEIEPLIERLPLEFRPMVQALNRTAGSLRSELQMRERALVSLREVLSDLNAASGGPRSGDAGGDLAQLSEAVGRLVLEREAGRQALERARDAAEAANRAKSEFLANMSHEIRTPMNGIVGMAQVLDGTTLTDDERKESLRILLNSSHALLTLINDILDLSKVESGKVELHPDRFSPGGLVRDTVRLFEGLARGKGLSLAAGSHLPEDCLCLADPLRVRQMISNLINNAIKFSDHGEIRVEVAVVEQAEEGALLEFSVSDQGPGIPPGQQALVFERFSQIDGSDTRQHGGTGLGLAIVLNLARLLGGDAGVSSTPGRGSRFWFRIRAPLSTRQTILPTRAAQRTAPRDAPRPGQAGRVLLAEDNVTNREVMELMLAREGLTVHSVGDGREAVEAVVSQAPFDLILMDIQMPVLDGLQATVQIRQWEAAQGRRHCPIVAVTANVYEENRRRCAEVGIDDFVAKPVILDQLRSVLRARLPGAGSGSTPAARTPALPPADLARVRAIAGELMPLLEKNMFTASAQFARLRDAVEGTDLEAKVAEIGRAIAVLDFRGAGRRLQPLLRSPDA